VAQWGFVPYAVLSVATTIPFAMASWWIIEKRALSFKKLDPKLIGHRVPGFAHPTSIGESDGRERVTSER
jgi:peptidoglycan/LPS O-acetylase OafA/YrhL